MKREVPGSSLMCAFRVSCSQRFGTGLLFGNDISRINVVMYGFVQPTSAKIIKQDLRDDI